MTWFTAQSVIVTNGQTIVSFVNATSDVIVNPTVTTYENKLG